MNPAEPILTRRRFLEGTARAAGLLAAGGSTVSWLRAASPGRDANPFALDVERLQHTDPKLIHYEQVARFQGCAPDPRRIAVGPDDRVYIAAANAVTILDCNGRLISEIACAAPVRCVAVAAEGTVYVGVKDHVETFDRTGKRLTTWPSAGRRAWLTGLAAGEKDVFAADSGNRCVLRYDKAGKLLGRIAERNKDRHLPGLVVPSPYLDVKLAPDGLLRVNNTGHHRVEAYTVDGDLEFFWGRPSAGIEGFCGCCNPVGLALLPDGRHVTCEKGLPRVKVYSPKGGFESVVAGTETFYENAKTGALKTRSDGLVGGLDAAVDSQQRIYILDLVANDVRIMQRKA